MGEKRTAGTILKGESTSFILELPPYRKPQIGQILIRSILDRTLFVLGRAISVALPAGIVIWLFANIGIGGENLLTIIAILGILLCVCPFSVPASTDRYNGFLNAIEKGMDLSGGVTAIYECEIPGDSSEDLSELIDNSIVKSKI